MEQLVDIATRVLEKDGFLALLVLVLILVPLLVAWKVLPLATRFGDRILERLDGIGEKQEETSGSIDRMARALLLSATAPHLPADVLRQQAESILAECDAPAPPPEPPPSAPAAERAARRPRKEAPRVPEVARRLAG